jgi:hypothetical protein
MIIPPLQGKLITEETVMFTAADEKYFNLYAKPLINSAKQYLEASIHIHLYNPSEETINWCKENEIGYSYEIFDESTLTPTFNRWKEIPTTPDDIRKKGHMIKDSSDLSRLKNEIKKTYFACTRFVRLSQLISKPTYVIMLDTDSIVRSSFKLPSSKYDIHIFEKNHKKHVPYTQHLASTIFYTGTESSFKLIQEHADLILREYSNDALYWFLDQDTLDIAIQKCKKKPLLKSLVDFEMNVSSSIWCAKGPRKFKDIYLNEIEKYL